MRRRDLLCRLAAALAAAACAAVTAAASRAEPATMTSATLSDVTPGWRVIGSARTLARADDETVAIVAGAGRYRALMVRVLDRDIQVSGLKVTFASGATEDLPFSGLLRAGSNSGVLGLADGTRSVSRVDVTYRPRRKLDSHATIEVLGLN